MAGKLAQEIKQTRPFTSLEEEALLNLGRTYEYLQQQVSAVLRPHELSAPQYNILRILRGAGPDGRKCYEIGERMITPEPDVTRLLDRLEKRGLLHRERSPQDRRVVITRITGDGLNVLAAIDEPLDAALRQHLGQVGQAGLRELINTLEELRGAPVLTGERQNESPD